MNLDEILEANLILADLQDAEEQMDYNRQLLTVKDPFTSCDEAFIKKFRCSKELIRNIVLLVTPFMEPAITFSAITIVRKNWVFLALGSYQEVTGTNSYIAVSQATVSRALYKVCNALLKPEIFERWIYFPQNVKEPQQLRNRFYTKYGILGVVGTIDCTHVAIIKPIDDNPEHIYVNCKNYHSINLQLAFHGQILNTNHW
ncbi:hypothetical protein RN001_010091 [Aquatica leii]|uniref:Nuclease HARBI1 n=1 Tax=Aquatica leii TaxID=1421715 RepID=A0AAN7P0E9_9COLE|nr:hypothetical protein RN001_010091 [Aquatica leii]